jgi:hypothetical protein
MRKSALLTGNLLLALAAALSLQAADKATQFSAMSKGSKMRIEGTSTIHDWQVESPLIGGTLEAGPGFPTEPGQSATPGKVQAKATAFVGVRGLKSLKEDGKPYSDAMDDIMYGKLKSQEYPRIQYFLDELVLKEPAKAKDAPYVFDAKGKLALAGVTNAISMPVNVLPLGEGKLKISGTTKVKMTDFKIDPPAPTVGMGLIKTGDEVKLIFDWVVAQKKPAAGASK